MDEAPHEEEKIERLRRAMYSRSLSPKLNDRARHDLQEDEGVVGEDWKREEQKIPGSIIAPRMLRNRPNHLFRWLLFAVGAFCVGMVGFFAYYFILGAGAAAPSAGGVGVSISGPPTITAGEVTELQLSISNNNRAALELADLIVNFPGGTRLPPNISTDATTTRKSLGTIESGAVQQIPIKAIFVGTEGQHSVVKVELEYRLRGSSAIFVTPANYEIILGSSPVSVSIDGNTETVSGQPILFTIHVASNATTPIKDALLSVSFPFGFVFSSAEPAPQSSGLWQLGDMSPGQSRDIAIRGTLTGQPGDERVFRIDVGTRETSQKQGIDTSLANVAYRTKISQAFLGLALSVNKGNGSETVVLPGETVNVSVSWKNNLSTPITDAVIVARLSGLAIDGETLQTTDGFYRSSDNTVLWDKTTTSGALATLAAGAEGSLGFSFKMPPSEALQGIKNPRLSITVHAAGKRLSESGVPENLQATAEQKIKLATNLQVSAQGLYYENPFGSVGPMPPQANHETTYAVVFTVTNTTSKIQNAKLTATLPSYVRLLGTYLPASESITFSNTNGTLSWNVGDIEPGVGVNDVLPRQVIIAVGLTPSTSQIGKEPVIIQNIALSGNDATTNSPASATAPDVTTNIVGDKGFSSVNATVVR